MADNPIPDERDRSLRNMPQPDYDAVDVDAGTSSAIHEIELEEAMDEVFIEAGDDALHATLNEEPQPENMPLEERDA